MSSIGSSFGNGSSSAGLDVQSTVDQLIYSERAPERLWQKQQAVLNAQATALRSIQSKLESLESSLNDLKDFSGTLSSRTASTTNSNIVTATALSSAISGTHTIVVKSLATTSSYFSKSISDPVFTFPTGSTIKIGIGAENPVALDFSGKSLPQAADYINANFSGVRAGVITDTAGSRLSIVSQTSGMPGSIKLSEDSSALDWTIGTTGSNALLTVDGIPVESTSNTVTGTIPGVTLTLSAKDENTTVTVTVAPDTGRAKQAIRTFVERYNAVITELNNQFTYDEATKNAGVLASDSTVRILQSTLLSDISHTVAGNGNFESIRAIGVEMKNDGTLEINDSTLDAVLKDHYTEFQNLFQNTTSDGFARHFGSDLMNLTDSVDGPVAVDLNGINESSTNISDQIDAFEVRIANRQQQLIDQYTQVDILLRKLPLMQSQLTAQLGALNTK